MPAAQLVFSTAELVHSDVRSLGGRSALLRMTSL